MLFCASRQFMKLVTLDAFLAVLVVWICTSVCVVASERMRPKFYPVMKPPVIVKIQDRLKERA